MLKSESILKLEEIGLNTLDYFITKDKKEAIHYLAKHANDLVSIRTERGSEWSCPFYYKVPGEKLLPVALKHLEEGYKLIFSPSLDIKGCLAFGTVALGTNEDVLEFVLGEGKVRELDNHPDRRTVIIPVGSMMAVKQSEFPGKAHMLNGLYKQAKDVAYDLIPCVLEWSYYSYPVGRLGHPDVWWEVRDYV